MKRITFLVVSGALGLVAGCSFASDDHPSAIADGGASALGGAGGSQRPIGHGAGSSGFAAAGMAGSTKGAEAGASGGGAGGEGEGDGKGDGGQAGFEPGVVVPVEPSRCSPDAKWGAPTSLSGVSSKAKERLLSITADELDVLFLRDDALLSAHRNAPGAPFDEASPLTIPAGYDVMAGAALSADGKRLVLVASDGRGFAQLRRASRNVNFDPTPEFTPFAALNQRALQTLEQYAAPVLAPDGQSLIFAASSAEPAASGAVDAGVAVVYESAWLNGAWAQPINISRDLFDGTRNKPPLPSGISDDSRTLFYFDQGTAHEVARFRDRPDAPLYAAVQLSGHAGAVPNAACDVIYFTRGNDVIFESSRR